MSRPILPGATLGVLGGGQLGRMFALAARRMGYRIAVLSPDADGPAAQVADQHFCASYDDLEIVRKFAQSVSVVTFEFENVLSVTAETAAEHAPVRPRGGVLHTTQNRAREKSALHDLGLPVAEFLVVDGEDDFPRAAKILEQGAVLKSASWGYDGKGQQRVTSAEELAAAWQALGAQTAVLEAWVPFEREVSVVGARGVDGEIQLYDPFENAHESHILDVTTWPAQLAATTRDEALQIGRRVLEGSDVVGVLCVEMFVLTDGKLLVNELAPRPHNSGHVTMDAHATSQFEQQVRAICGLPLGSVAPKGGGAAMANLLGDRWQPQPPNWSAVLGQPGVTLHLYGKEEARPGRKMGHINALASSAEEAKRHVLTARHAMQS